jgi:hypothetical protein
MYRIFVDDFVGVMGSYEEVRGIFVRGKGVWGGDRIGESVAVNPWRWICAQVEGVTAWRDPSLLLRMTLRGRGSPTGYGMTKWKMDARLNMSGITEKIEVKAMGLCPVGGGMAGHRSFGDLRMTTVPRR